MPNVGEVHATISLSDLLTPQLAKAEKQLEGFATQLTGMDVPLARLGGSLQQQSTQAAKLIENLQLGNKHLAGLTAAYTMGETAVSRYNATMEIEIALARTGITATDDQGRAITDLIRQQHGLDAALQKEINTRHARTAAIKQSIQDGYSLVTGLDKEIQNLHGLSAAYSQGEAAVHKYNLEQRIQAELSRIGSDGKDEQAQRIRAQMTEQEALTAKIQGQATALKTADAANKSYADSMKNVGTAIRTVDKGARDLTGALEKEVRQLTGLSAAYQQGAGAVKRYNAEQKIENDLSRVGLNLDSEEIAKIRALMVQRNTLTDQIQRQDAALQKVNKTKTTLFEKINSLRFGYFALSAAVGISVSSFIDAQRALERMQNTFLAATGSAVRGAQEMVFVREQANRLGLDFKSTGQEYAKFAAATKGTALEGEAARKVFVAVSTASTAMGLSAEQSAGALNALQQMVSKATVQSEELRGQLSERIPGSFAMAAKAMGLTETAFNKQIEKGNILARDLLPRLAEAWMVAFSPAAAKGATLLNAEINRLKTTLFDFLSTSAQTTDIASLTREMAKLTGTFIDITKAEPGTSSALGHIGASLSSLIGIVNDVATSFNSLLTIFQGTNSGTGMKGPLQAISGITGSFHQMLRSFISNNDELVARSSQSAKDAANVEFQRVMNLTNNQALAYDAGIRILQQKMEEANARLEKSAQGRGPQKGRKTDSSVGLAADIRAMFERDKKLMASMADTWGDNAKEVKAYDNRLAHLLKVADPLGEIMRDFNADLKTLNETYKDKSSVEYVKIYAGLVDAADKAKNSLLRQSQVWKDAQDRIRAAGKATEETAKFLDKVDKSVVTATKDYTKHVEAVKANLAEYENETAALKKLEDARYSGIDAIIAAERELYITQETVRIMGENADRTEQEFLDLAAAIAVAAGQRFDDANKDRKTDALIDQWQEVASLVGEFDSALGKALSSTVKLVAGVQKIKAAGEDAGKAFSGWVDAITAGLNMLNESGVLQEGNKDGGGFGGTPEGNYAAEGAMVGAVIGAIIGAFTVIGPQAGAAIGSAAGGMMGGMIKKGAEEALGTLQIDTNGVYVAVRKAEGDLRGPMNQLGNSIGTAISDLVASIGGTIGSLPMVDMKIRDGVIGVVIGGVKAKFKEMDDAISFAVAELLKQGEILGIDAMLKNALQNTTSSSLESLSRDLEAVMSVLSFGMTDSQQAIQSFTNELDGLRNQMTRLLTDSDQLAKAMGNLALEETRRWQSSRDAITGDKKSNAEKLELLKQDGLMWNAEKALRIAELKFKLETLKAEAAIGVAGVDLYQAEGRARYADLLGHREYVDGLNDFNMLEGDIFTTDLSMRASYAGALADTVAVSLTLLDVQINALGEMIRILENMPDIDVPNLRIPGGSGGGRNTPRGPTDEELAAAEAARILAELMKQLAIDFDHAWRAGDQWATSLYDLELRMEEMRVAAAGNAEALRKIEELFKLELFRLLEEAVDSLGLASEDTRDQFMQLNKTIKFLEKNGRMTAAIMRELSDSMFISLADGLLQYVDNEETRMFVEDLRFRMEMANYKLQFQMMKKVLDLTLEEIAIIDGLFAQIDAAYAAGQLDFQLPRVTQEDRDDQGSNSDNERERRFRQDLLNAIDRMRKSLEDYNEFLKGLHTTDLGGDTLQQQTDATMEQFLETLALAQAGNLDAIELLPSLAEHLLGLAGDLYDPASTGYQGIVDMIEAAMTAIGLDLEGALGQVPATMDDAVNELHTIAEILAVIASGDWYEPDTDTGGGGGGGNGNGNTDYDPAFGSEELWQMFGTLGTLTAAQQAEMDARLARYFRDGQITVEEVARVMNQLQEDLGLTDDEISAKFQQIMDLLLASLPANGGNSRSYVATAPGSLSTRMTDTIGNPSISKNQGVVEVVSPQLTEVSQRLQAIERRLGTQNDLTVDQTTKLEKKFGQVTSFSGQRGYNGPIRNGGM